MRYCKCTLIVMVFGDFVCWYVLCSKKLLSAQTPGAVCYNKFLDKKEKEKSKA